MKILLILAIAMAGGLALSRLMKLLNLPNVTGYLIAGILIGPFVLKLVTNVDIKSAKIITTTALGFIAFSIGGEFKLSLLKKLGGKIVVITVVQAVMTVLLRFCLCRVNTAFPVRCFSVQLRLQRHLPQHCLLFANTRQRAPLRTRSCPLRRLMMRSA